MIATNKPFAQASSDLAEQAHGAANQAIDSLTEKASNVKDQAAPVLNRVAAKAEELAKRSADVMRDRGAYVKERAARASDMTVGYIKDEPVKSILIAAAAGAAITALITLLLRERD